MSRQSKNARNLERARSFSKQRQNGDKGPSKTNPQHGKRWTYRHNPEIQKRIMENIKATSAEDKTSGKKILEKAGGASKDKRESA